jgi:hypothetical protein
MIVALIYLVFSLWALFLALRVSDQTHRVLHVLLALVFGPVYVMSYYLSDINIKQE